MNLKLRPIVRVRTYEEVVERIQDEILGGRLRKGDRLPGERQLSEMLGVSRATVREALRVLETLQIVRVPGRSGPDGGAVVQGEPGDVLARLLKLQLALSQYSMRDLIETRCSVEAASVGLAARRARPEQLTELATIVEAMDAPSTSMQQYNELDTAFHAGVAASSGNALLHQLMHAIRDAIKQEMLNAFARVDDWGETAGKLTADHQAILGAIRAGDEEQARAAVIRHVIDFQPRWQAPG